MQIESNCARCGKRYIYSGLGRRSKFCSIAHWGIPKQCAYCGIEFWAKANRQIYHDKHCSAFTGKLPTESRTPWVAHMTPTTVETRFWRSVDMNGPVPQHDVALGACWLWTGIVVKDYPKINIGRRQVGAHRYSWELHNGRAVPDDLWVLHKCDRPLCVNPSHLYPGTAKENARDRGLRSLRCPHCGWHLTLGDRPILSEPCPESTAH